MGVMMGSNDIQIELLCPVVFEMTKTNFARNHVDTSIGKSCFSASPD